MAVTFLVLLLSALATGLVSYSQNADDIEEAESEIARIDRSLDLAQSEYEEMQPRLESIQEKIASCLTEPDGVGCNYVDRWEDDLEDVIGDIPGVLEQIGSLQEEKLSAQTELIGLQAVRPTILPTWGAVSITLLAIWGGFRLAYLVREETKKMG